jgi:hypothetical protein
MQKPGIDIFKTGGGVALTERRRDGQTTADSGFFPTGKIRQNTKQRIRKGDKYKPVVVDVDVLDTA